MFGLLLETEPEVVARHAAAIGQVEEGNRLAGQGNIEEAISAYQQAQDFNAEVDLDPSTGTIETEPEVVARKFAAIEKGKRLVRQGDFETAISAYQKAQELDPEVEIRPQDWNSLCWNGSLHGHAADVMFACEKAVAIEPEHGGIIDSRGLARALTGDVEGAIADFEVFIKWTPDGNKKQQRQAWIDALRSGENPFTEEVLERLR